MVLNEQLTPSLRDALLALGAPSQPSVRCKHQYASARVQLQTGRHDHEEHVWRDLVVLMLLLDAARDRDEEQEGPRDADFGPPARRVGRSVDELGTYILMSTDPMRGFKTAPTKGSVSLLSRGQQSILK
jgi:hypothetical protein